MKKRVLAVLLSAAMAVGMLAACGGAGNDTESNANSQQESESEVESEVESESESENEGSGVTLDEASAIDITSTLAVNEEGTYVVEEVDGGYKVTATETKGEWAFFWFAIDQNVKDYSVVEIVVEGAAGTNYLTKLEGGEVTPVEVARTCAGSEETIQWEVAAENLTEVGGEKFLIFLNQGVYGATADAPESITIKSVKLYKKAGETAAADLDITSTLAVNEEGTYTVEAVDGGNKVTATATKGEWAFVYFTIDENAKAYNAVEIVVEGKAGTSYLLKLEGGDAAVVENAYTLSGSEETITWEVSADNFTSNGGQKLIIFLNQGVAGATEGDEEYITIKSVKLITK